MHNKLDQDEKAKSDLVVAKSDLVVAKSALAKVESALSKAESALSKSESALAKANLEIVSLKTKPGRLPAGALSFLTVILTDTSLEMPMLYTSSKGMTTS